MPRRKVPNESIDEQPMIMLPPARTHKRHGNEVDPYEQPAGHVPLQTTLAPIERKLTNAEEKRKTEIQAEVRERAERYVLYLDELSTSGGDTIQALAVAFGVSLDAARANRTELLEEVRRGIGSTDLGKMLEANDLDTQARVRLLKKHAYSPVPAASLKALDMINEMEGGGPTAGSFEQYLRMAKQRK